MTITHFPIELLKLITIELSDKDLCSFSLTCRIFHDTVQGDQTIWRSRFINVYDEPAKSRRANYDWRKSYQTRQRLLLQELKNFRFQTGTTKKELEVLEILQEILLDARGHLDFGTQAVQGSNFKCISAATLPHSLFNSRCFDFANPLLQAISLFLTPLSSLPETSYIPGIQSIIYSPDTKPAITADGFPNIRTLEALAQFFTYHIHPSSESLVFHQKTLLQPNEFPSFWEGGPIEEESRIPTKWFGAYSISPSPCDSMEEADIGRLFKAYLSHPSVHAIHLAVHHLPDRSDDHLVDMTLSFASSSSFSSHTTECRFTGAGRDYTDFVVQSGKLTRLPSPPGASAIPGWKKVQFIKDYSPHRWAYEGVMLPGNNMILGHWKRSFDQAFAVFSGQGGPFIFWAAPETSSLVSRDNRLSI